MVFNESLASVEFNVDLSRGRARPDRLDSRINALRFVQDSIEAARFNGRIELAADVRKFIKEIFYGHPRKIFDDKQARCLMLKIYFLYSLLGIS